MYRIVEHRKGGMRSFEPQQKHGKGKWGPTLVTMTLDGPWPAVTYPTRREAEEALKNDKFWARFRAKMHRQMDALKPVSLAGG